MSPIIIAQWFGFTKVSSTSLFMTSSEFMTLLVHIFALSLVCSAMLCTEQVLLLWG